MEFRSNEVRVAEGKYNNKSININKCFAIPISEGLYEDGVIKDMDSFSQELHIGLSRHNVLHGDVYAVINSSNIIIREIKIPKVEAKQISSILKYQLEEFLPVDPEGYVVQHIPLDLVNEDGVEKQNVMLVGVPKFMVETHLNLLNNLGLKPQVLDYAGNAISKLIRLNDKINGIYDNNTNIACVDLDEKSTAISIISKGLMSLTRVVKEDILPIASDSYDSDSDYGGNVAVVSGIKSNLAAILDKIDMVFRFYNSKEKDKDIDLIMIYGDYSHTDGIENFVSNYLNKPCVKLNVLDKVKFNGDAAKYANAIGALIRLNGVK